MTLIKKSDVKNHLSTHARNGQRLHQSLSQPDATGFSGEESTRSDSNPSQATEKSIVPDTARETAVSKSARA